MKLRGPLEPGEHVLVATRAHGVQLLAALMWSFCAMVAWSFSSALWWSVAWAAYPAAGLSLWFLFLALKRISRWLGTSYMVTTHRLVIRRGLARSADVSLPLRSLEGMSLGTKALLGAVRAGNLTAHSRGIQHVLRDVPEPEKFSHTVQRAQESLLISQRYY